MIPDGKAALLRKTVLLSCVVLVLSGFVSMIVLDAYLIDNRPREAHPTEGRVYPKYIKSSYGATVYLTHKEKDLSDWLFPLSLVIVGIGIALNSRWKILAPYKSVSPNVPIAPKKKSPE